MKIGSQPFGIWKFLTNFSIFEQIWLFCGAINTIEVHRKEKLCQIYLVGEWDIMELWRMAEKNESDHLGKTYQVIFVSFFLLV